jgi:hypothetical protein
LKVSRLSRAIEQSDGAIAIGQGGAADNHHNQQAKRIDQDVPFAPLDLLAPSIAVAFAFFGGLDTLAGR